MAANNIINSFVSISQKNFYSQTSLVRLIQMHTKLAAIYTGCEDKIKFTFYILGSFSYKKNSFLYERLRTRPRFETEAQDNSIFRNSLLNQWERSYCILSQSDANHNSSLWKRVIAWERSRAASRYGIIWEDADRNKQEEFSAECHSVDWF